jgi:hypothetical protein
VTKVVSPAYSSASYVNSGYASYAAAPAVAKVVAPAVSYAAPAYSAYAAAPAVAKVAYAAPAYSAYAAAPAVAKVAYAAPAVSYAAPAVSYGAPAVGYAGYASAAYDHSYSSPYAAGYGVAAPATTLIKAQPAALHSVIAKQQDLYVSNSRNCQ